MKSINQIITLFLFSAFILSCNSENKTLNKESNQKLNLTEYYNLKDALVSSNEINAQKAAKSLLENSNYGKEINAVSEKIANSNDLEMQRIAFEELSIMLYEKIKNKASGETIYKQFCPMAFDGKGAFWLSNEEKIMNPYYGDQMLHCGKVIETL